MIISKTPFRVSFFGGGTDLPIWYKENGGQVLSSAIDKYCYISCRYLPPFFEHKYRIVYSLIENVQHYSEIKHPSVRAILDHLNCEKGLEVHHDGDLPARSGLGSSSSFTVGLLNSIHALNGEYRSSGELGEEAIHIEQDVIKENVGSQDQLAVAHGGFNHIVFNGDGSHVVKKMVVSSEYLESLQENLMLFFTGLSRTASEIEQKKIENIKNRNQELRDIHSHVDEAITIMNSGVNKLDSFGYLLNETWKVKKSLSQGVSTDQVDEIYEAAMSAGALGGKLLGAGGGGFILFYVPKEKQKNVREKLKKLIRVPFRFENEGSRIVYFQPDKINGNNIMQPELL
jgi:D-glycero-alpha-D-manno-heptose-7-phosphate kinase